MKSKINLNLGFTFIFLLLSYLSKAQPDEAWESLFNGINLEGWTIVDPPVSAVVKDSSILIHMTPHTSRHAFIRTNKQYKDFIFEVDFKRDKAIDSGVLFRGVSTSDSAYTALFGYMVKIDPRAHRLWTGGIFLDYGKEYNWLESLEGNEKGRQAEKGKGEWNRLRIEAIGDEMKVWLNDIPTAYILDDRYKAGYIAFKIHHLKSGDENKTKLAIAYKNARIITQNLEKYARSTSLPKNDTRNDQ
jgi:hypothetical protein